jgi:serine/threonine protein kinase
MGEVYGAFDRRLAREVAVKVLREETAGADGLAGVEREARLLASLNHPGIAILYGMEEWNGCHFLVMELVEGETLAERIRRGPISIAESLPLFWQIAQALEAAHQRRIIHRDLKPANIKITPEGKSKLLDFGLAKAFVSDLGSGVPAESPTITRESRVGVGGTIAYMSPEQARGQSLDQRTDIWSYGCCWFEAISGARAFHGKTAADTIAAILRSDPEWVKLPRETPREVRELLRLCLERELSRRASEMSEVRLAIERVFSPSPVPAVSFAAPRESFSMATLQPYDERTATERPPWNLKAHLKVDRHGVPEPPTATTALTSKGSTRQPRSCTLTLGIAFTMLAAMGTGLYLFRSARTLPPAESQPSVSWSPELEERMREERREAESNRLRLDAEEVLSEIAELKARAGEAEATGWERAEGLEELGRQAYAAKDYETANRRLRLALDDYQRASSMAAAPRREEQAVARLATSPKSAFETDRSAILAVLADYEKAVETKDFALLRAVKPNLAADEEKAFRRTDQQEIELRVDDIGIQGGEATAHVTRSDRLDVQDALQQSEARKQTFHLRKEGAKWVIVEIRQ